MTGIPKDDPLKEVNEKIRGRWIHPCEREGVVFGVLYPHPCPICGEMPKDYTRYEHEEPL